MRWSDPGRLRNRLVLAFLAATLIPTAAILWMSAALIEHSLSWIDIEQLDVVSKSLQGIARDYYRQSCQDLKREARAGQLKPQRFASGALPGASMRQFWSSKEPERFELSEPHGDRLIYMVRNGPELWVYTRDLHGVRMEELSRQYQEARAQVERIRQRDLRRGFIYTLLSLSAVIWILALVSVVYLSNRISRPIQDLTAGMRALANGDFEVRLNPAQRDEVGRALQAFNHTADRLQQDRDRLVYLTRIASWQTLARKMAHELKNSLTPIRLTVEEILARSPSEDRRFLEQAAQVVVGEVESLERRVQAFSEFASEPALNPSRLDLNPMVEERVRFLEVGHPGVQYRLEQDANLPAAWADADQVKGILTNLLENAAEAVNTGGIVLALTRSDNGRVLFEVHDSGPGLSKEARRTLFEPSISFKEHGMGLGLSISRKNALLAGGDLQAIEGSLGGAGFRLVLPTEGENHGG